MTTNALNWHDARAVMLVDKALQHGFSDDLVAEISEALQDAQRDSSADR